MPRRERPLILNSVPAVFAQRLRDVREASGLTYRELAVNANYSHVHLSRAASGTALPMWPVVAAFLKACGVNDVAMQDWESDWAFAKEQMEARKRGRFATHRGQNPHTPADIGERLVRDLLDVNTPAGLRDAIKKLARRAGCRSLRSIADGTGIPKSTLHEWLGRDGLPSAGRLDELVVALGATAREQREFAQCRERIDHRPAQQYEADPEAPEGTHYPAEHERYLLGNPAPLDVVPDRDADDVIYAEWLRGTAERLLSNAGQPDDVSTSTATARLTAEHPTKIRGGR